MKKLEKICLSCQHFHLTDEHQGRCRVDKGRIDKDAYPVTQHNHTCDTWKDGGQQYHIRVGWIKSVKAKSD